MNEESKIEYFTLFSLGDFSFGRNYLFGFESKFE